MFKKKKLTLNEIINLAKTIDVFNKSTDESGVDAKLGYKMARFLMKLSKPIEAYEKQRLALFKKYGEEKEGQYELLEKNYEKFNKELLELLETEESVEVLSKKIKISEFGNLKIKSSFFIGFDEYIED